MERMINTRLVEYLEMRNILDKVQCGSRKGRSTNNHLVRLEAGIWTAFSREHFVAVFFDLEKHMIEHGATEFYRICMMQDCVGDCLCPFENI